MSSIAFDTHAFVKRLTQSGMDEQQAEALAECQTQLINDSLATKLDIEEVKKEIETLRLETKESIEALRLETKESIEALRLETKESIEALRLETREGIEKVTIDMHKMELRLTIRLGSIIVITTGIFATLIKLF